MSLNTQKEDFSYAYIYAITSSVGYSLQAATRRLDDSGIDAIITRLPVYCTGDLIKENDIFILKNPRQFNLDAGTDS